MKALAVAAALFLLSGCAGTAVRNEAAPAPGEKVFELSAGSYFFAPSRLTVPAGEPVVLRIRDEATVVPHAFVLSAPDGAVVARSELRRGGTTLVRIPPLRPGAYPFFCDKSLLGSSHRAKGMEGVLTAAPPDAVRP